VNVAKEGCFIGPMSGRRPALTPPGRVGEAEDLRLTWNCSPTILKRAFASFGLQDRSTRVSPEAVSDPGEFFDLALSTEEGTGGRGVGRIHAPAQGGAITGGMA
jgi:hypothetical protein